jgi:hypothetical protein
MKRFICFAVTAVIIACLAIAVAVLRGINHMSWGDYTPSQIKTLAIDLEIYKERSGNYSSTLAALKDLDVEGKDYLRMLLSGSNGTRFSLTVMDKGFGICAVRTATMLSQYESMSNYFVAGTLFNSAILSKETNQPTVSK